MPPGFTGNVGSVSHFARLQTGGFLTTGPNTAAGETVFLFGADGTLVRSLNVSVIEGRPALNTVGGAAALPDGRFILSGPIQSTLRIGYVLYEADGTPVPFDDGGVQRFVRDVYGYAFFDGGFQAGPCVQPTPDGRLIFASTSVKDSEAGRVGFNNDGFPINAGNAGSTSRDIRLVIAEVDGAVSADSIVTEGDVPFPMYTIFSRFGSQIVSDLDVLADGRIVVSYLGDRFQSSGASRP